MKRVLERCAPGLVFALHAALVARTVAPRELLTGPILNGDYGAHYYEASNLAEHFRQAGLSILEYDPFWMAGYPDGLVAFVDNKLFAALFLVVPADARAIAFNAAILLMLLAVPALGYAAGRLAYGARAEATWVALGGTVVSFAVPLGVFYWAGGTVSFLFASALAVPVSLGLSKAVDGEGGLSRRALVWVLAMMFCLVIHPAVLPVLAAALTPLLARRGSHLVRNVKGLAWASVAALVALTPPLAAARFVSHANAGRSLGWWTSADFLQGGWARFWEDWVVRFLHAGPGWTGGAGGLVALFILASGGAVEAMRIRRESSSRSLGPWIAVSACFLLAYASSGIHLVRFFQPYRYLVPLAFFLCVPAGRGAARCMSRLRARSLVAFLEAGVVVASIVQGGMASDGVALGAVDDLAESGAVAFFREGPRDDGRVLAESLWTDLPAFADGSRRVTVKRFALLPLRSGRECLGYQGTSVLSPERYAAFGYGRLLGRDLRGMDEREFGEILGRYAISAILACAQPTREMLARFNDTLEGVREVSGCEILRVRQPQVSRFLEGSGRVEATLDRIAVSDAEGGRIVLKYHWVPGLRAIPPLRLEEAKQPGAPVGFIAAYPEGRRDFTIVPERGLWPVVHERGFWEQR